MSVIEHYKFVKNGAWDCGNSHFVLKSTSCCDKQCVEDEEICTLYVNALDLTQQVSLLRSPSEPRLACPFCRAANWDLKEVEGLSMVAAEWEWAALER